MFNRVPDLRYGIIVGGLSALAPFFLSSDEAWASAPVEPLPIPFFSMDLQSPTVVEHPIDAADVLAVVPGGGIPSVAIHRETLRLFHPNDELDGMSFNRAAIARRGRFVLLFSVDRFTTGDVPPDPELVKDGVPFNVADQATRGHAAGDGYVSLNLFERSGMVPNPLRAALPGVLVVNNYDEGGSDFEAQPPTSARDYVNAPQDDVDGIAEDDPSFAGLRGESGFYYTVSSNSPSLLESLPGDSGADIFFHPDPSGGGFPEIFARAPFLGLLPTDDINGLVIFDLNGNGVFDVGDMVLFTLAPWSTSLRIPGRLPNVSDNGAADVFAVEIGAAGVPEIRLFAAAADLGLGGPADNVDALEVIATDDAYTFARLTGIRLIQGDWDNDGDVDIFDYPKFAECMSGPVEGGAFVEPEPLCQDVFDYNSDTDIDLHDFARFQIVFGFGTVPLMLR